MPDAIPPRFGGFDPTVGAGVSPPPSLDRPFTVPLLIRGSRGGIVVLVSALLSVSFLVMGINAQLRWSGDPGAVICLFVGSVAGVVSVVRFTWSFRRRRWLEVARGGFVISSSKGKVVYRDDQVVGLSFRYEMSNFTRCAVTIETDREDDEPIRCSYLTPPGQADPLAAFWHRLQQALTHRITSQLADGASLSGMGWRVDAHGLSYTHRRKIAVLPIERIQKAGFFDRHLCLWKGDEELPFLRTPAVSRNVNTLATLIWGKIGDSSQTPALPGKPLGRIVLRRRSADILLGIGGFLFVGGCIFFAFFARSDSAGLRPGSLPLIVGCALLFASPFLGFFVRGIRYRSLVLHEFGVSQSTWTGRRTLLFSEIETFTCDANVRLDFLPAPGSSLRPIRFRHCARQFDPDLASFVEHLSKVMMARMGTPLQQAPIDWTAQLRFLPGGLEYKTRGLLGRAAPVTVPYHLTSFRIVGKHFFLYVRWQPKPVAKELIAGPNFYPGYYLLQWVYACLQQNPPTTGEPRTEPSPSVLPPRSVDERFRGGLGPEQPRTE